MESYILNMVAVTCLLVGAWGVLVSSTDQFSATCIVEEIMAQGGEYSKNVDSVLQTVQEVTPNTGEMDFRVETTAKPVVYAAGHCFNSNSTATNLTCFQCLKRAADVVKNGCPTSVRATSGSSAAGCVVKYDNVPLQP